MGYLRNSSTAATTADKCCDSFDQISCMCAFLHGCVCCHCDQIDFSVLFRCQNNNTFSDLFLELVAQIAQTVHVYIFHTCCKKLYSGNFLYLIHHITHGIFCKFALQALYFAL